jgi:glycine cleavage system H protein
MVPKDLSYTDQHEWVRMEEGVATVGITDHAQEALGDITFVELPAIGKQVAKGDEVCAIESCKAAASIYAPFPGQIVGGNEDLEDAPESVNKDPYGTGWVYRLEAADPADADSLMDAAAYEAFLAEQEA